VKPLLVLTVGVAAVVAFSSARSTGPVHAQSGTSVLVDLKAYQDLRWRTIGPFRGGRSTAAAGVRTQPGVFYMGATGGGVWKTENAGITWVPIADGQIPTGSIGAIDVSDSNPNVVYVGTGSEAIRSNVIVGRGVYKSTDAGRTWQFSGLTGVGQIGQLKIHPKNPDIAYVAAIGQPFGWGPERGVYRTKDGGKTWQKVLFINDQTGAVSVAINWLNPNEVYVGAWRAQRKPWTIISGGPASEGGVYKTTDGGDHWSHMGSGLPDDLIGKVWVDVAQSNPKVVYAQVEAQGAKGGLYRSSDSGATWALQNSGQQLRARPFYFNKVFVSPKDENEVFVTELNVHRSTDGGRTFSTVATPHGDNHVMWINPENPSIYVETNDGGANVTQDGGRSWSTENNQPTAEIYMVDADEQFPYRIYGPQQDNNDTISIPSLPPSASAVQTASQLWQPAAGCESGQVRPIPSGKIVYGDCKGEFGRMNADTGQEQSFWINPQQRYGKNPANMTYRFVRQAPVEIDAHNPNIVYHGSQYVHKTIDGGLHWTRVSPDLTANSGEGHVESGEPITRDMTGEEVYAALYSMRSSRLEPGVFWTGSNDGPVWVTRDSGKTWKNVTPSGLPPGGRVHTIEDSPHRKGSAYVSVYRMYLNDFKPYLYLTNDYGAHWTLLTDGANGIPADQPMHVVREDPEQEGLLYAGTLQGAYVSFDQGKHWQSLQQNLPATPVTDIKVHHGDLVASTMGRGFWILDDVTPLRQMAASVMKPSLQTRKAFDGSNAFLFTPAPVYRMRYTPMAARPDGPEYPAAGARIDYYLGGASGDVRLEILDATGKVVRSYASTALPAKVGTNRFVWDLRYPGGSGGGGPLVAPGSYKVRLTAGGATKTESLIVKIDPRIARDGVTVADLVEQAKFALKIRDQVAEARQLATRLRQAIDARRGDQAALQGLWERLMTKSGPYEDQMFIDQLSNVGREIGQADQKIGASAYERFNDLMKEWAGVKAAGARAIQ
jgi:photosystem II stability/assembly factor-like uncharacterized protein